ncbi:SDR family oxidoreductase [Hymenobacter sp. PAMC 26628]|uniref:SDR family oxidoreductase n=1 Tax=Hymenobacter sp. PAMC 26628 TaxID=1484118 RepID=UPI00077020D7|nr:aldehyde reductase [Hymenobacter sp. PAMC 26628]AMJ67787.1 3-beta hydroxysteroid dehydrogenase [Hymenobacter sp. PAMC 26628]
MKNPATVLVTGGTGFVGAQCILALLHQGYRVRTTLRSLASQASVLETLKTGGTTPGHQLEFVEADLTSDKNWAEALQGCAYVLHVASPLSFATPTDESAHLKPAVEGTLRVLKAARDAGVKRVVLTSSFGAVGFSHTDRTTETTEVDWTDPQLKGLSTYEKSKGLAERAAWEFIKNEGGALELSVINPVAILGPSLGSHTSGSFDIIRHLVDGSLKAVPNIPLNVVDVRDVADLHVRAMTTPAANGQRFIASADGQISMPEIAQLLQRKLPELAEKVATKTVPDWVIRFASLFNAQAKTGAMFLQVNRRVSTAKAKQLLGWKPLATNEQAILAAAESLIKYQLIE